MSSISPARNSLLEGPASIGLQFACLVLLGVFCASQVTSVFSPRAEDGIFYLSAFSSGISSIRPIADAFLLLPSLVALIASSISLTYAPMIGTFVSIALISALACYVRRSSFNWIFQGRMTSILVSLLMVIGPGTAEIGGSLICTSYICGLWLLVLLLERPIAKPSFLFFLSWAVLCLSSNLAFVCFPLVFFRLWKLSRAQTIYCASLALAPVLLMTILAPSSGCIDCRIAFNGAAGLIETVARQLLSYWLLVPVFGARETIFLSQPYDMILFGVVAALLAIAQLYLFSKLTKERKHLFLGLLACFCLYPVAHKLGRAYHTDPFLHHNLYGNQRFSFLPSMIAVFGWIILLQGLKSNTAPIVSIAIGLVATILPMQSVLSRLAAETTLPSGDWVAFSERLLSALQNKYTDYPIEVALWPTNGLPPAKHNSFGWVQCKQHEEQNQLACSVFNSLGRTLEFSIDKSSNG
jgi:hypothetical protein